MSQTQDTVEVVLDTNVVLDWLVFEDPSTRALDAAILAGRWRWVACAAMREEALEVFDRLRTLPALQRWAPRREGAIAALATWLHEVPPPGPLPQTLRLLSSDPDDQVYIDLALARRVPWLFSRDRALLRLARRARPQGVGVLSPAQWLAMHTGDHDSAAATAARP